MLNLFYSLPLAERILLIFGIAAIGTLLVVIKDILWPISEDEAYKRLCWVGGIALAVMAVGLLGMM